MIGQPGLMTDPLEPASVIRMNPCRTQGCNACEFESPSNTHQDRAPSDGRAKIGPADVGVETRVRSRGRAPSPR